MNTKRKVSIDRLIGKPMVIFLNLLARALGAVLKIDHSLSKPPQRIVVCKYLGMGSIIQSTPLLLTLKKNFPQAKIMYLTSAGNKKITAMIPAVDETLTVDDSSFSKLFFSTIHVLLK